MVKYSFLFFFLITNSDTCFSKLGVIPVWYWIGYHDQGIFYKEGKGCLGLLVSEESLPLSKAEKLGSSQRAEGLHFELQTEYRV